jgi:signal transduction histidine kinase
MQTPPFRQRARRPAALFLAVTGFALLVVAGIWATVLHLTREDRHTAFVEARAELVGAQKTIGAQIGRTAESALGMLAAVETWLATHRADDAAFRSGIADLIDGMQRRNEVMTVIRLLDAEGRTIPLEAGDEEPIDLSGRDFFRALVEQPARDIHFGLQINDEIFGGAVIALAMKARPNPLGAAVIVTIIPMQPLKDAFADLFISAPGTIGILRKDGYVLLRTPDPERFTGQWVDRQRLVDRYGEQGSINYFGNYINPAGAPRLMAYVQLPTLPLAVFASFAAPDIAAKLAPAAQTRLLIASVMTLAAISIAALIAWLVHRRERQARMLRDALIAAEEASESKSAFLANVSHELRTPLNAVIGFSEVMIQQVFGPLNERYRIYLSDILVSSRHLLGIVNQLLSMTAIEAGRIGVNRETVELGTVVEEVAQMLSPLAAERQVQIALSSPPEPIEIETDRSAVRQTLINLAGNAVKFCRTGRKVEIAWVRGPDAVVDISVADEGDGIAPESLPRIFEPFWQEKEPYQRRQGGLGLGLPVAKRLVEALGGVIDVESEQGKGSRFWVRLPEKVEKLAA